MSLSRYDMTKSFIPLRIAVVTLSDTRTLEDDKSGDFLVKALTEAGHHLASRILLRDEAETIRAMIRRLAEDPDVDVVITTGGTGFTARDVTVEAIVPLFDKTMEGFSALFHRLSYETVGTSTIQSRATAGLIGATFVFVLPGSPGACRDAWEGILRSQLDSRHRPCNLAEILPRVQG